ncbi:extracellular solute-binding protein family 1 [Thermoanaerobacter mathranii subsp. mathranii str. A3]|jgi:putative aldouronate transport system substrate-binding protein|uniref:Extracellular solute-binding protein family 1 n=1 Tax=Thermoanaerobacter mathranii subsp. mathranii (strain DSM 11426 / CCUG 53645 / CIP 108742 / A3) TaxID=583358 RepID=A0ABM5LMT7_THEM3|nr:extracellular solute-binding protein [Thermoanaerobacter mathranii]ADH60028.1 extracellular solute-binding protein family 1 [Thermoanaerobacter mathranii subsp. mathranii str. A3]MDK2823699.1 putative aldouronate transport system substrate-binding protein [Clostridia bacterium]
MSRKFKILIVTILVLSLLTTLFAGCSSKNSSETQQKETQQAAQNTNSSDPENKHFYSEKPLEFTMLYSEHPAYPYKEDWLLWKAIKDMTNVSLKLTVVPMSDYDQKRSLLISTGEAPEIIPKTYPGQEVPFIPSGAILPISDYIDEMPNFSRQIKEWNLQDDLNTLKQKDGKFYVLPGLHEIFVQDYSLAIRLDIFEKNNIPVPNSWDELYDALKKLKEIYPNIIPFSDRWQGKSLLNVAAPTFGVQAGWGAGNGMYYYRDKDEFGFYPITDDYKNMLSYFNKLVKEGLMDPESFTQNDDQAIQKFVTGKSFVISTNSQELVNLRNKMKETMGEDAFKVVKILPPAGPKGAVVAGGRLENGIMISKNALKNPNFHEMLKFIDWLWYSEEGQTLTKWGVEGVTYKKVDGKFELMPDVTAGFLGLNPNGTKDLRKDFGFGNGVFILMYGGPKELAYSYMSDEDRKFAEELDKTRELLPPAPPVLFDEVQREQANMISQPLMDYVEQMTLKFILGQASLEKDWDNYVQQCRAKGADKLTQLTNEVYKSTKDMLK